MFHSARKAASKLFLVLLSALLFASFGNRLLAQPNIVRVEYYIDSDPGRGSATPLSFSAAKDLTNLPININPASLSSGVHQVGVRARNADGHWSLDNRWLFFKPFSSNSSLPPASNLSYAEYYIDSDPGYGGGTPVAVNGTNAANLVINLNPTSLSSGIHQLGFRAKNADGAWTLDNRWLFFKPFSSNSNLPPAPSLSYAEYYIDADPGRGSGTAVAVSGTNANNLLININPATLSNGIHQLGFRAKDADGNWSLDNRWLFFKPFTNNSTLPPAPNLAYAEYYIDEDPGKGSGTPVAVNGTNAANLVININPADLSSGVHQLGFRAKDEKGVWSLDNRWLFFKPFANTTSLPPVPNLTALEYYVDEDPGLGFGVSVSIPVTKNISDLAIPVQTDGLDSGSHKFFIRAKDANGSWSLVNVLEFKVGTPLDRTIKLGTIATTVCAGAKLAIPYTVKAQFNAGNVFTAQLSASNGDFTNAITIGTLAKRDSGTINATIPANISAGNNYRVRIIASSPLDTSGVSVAIGVKRVPEAGYNIDGDAQVCLGTVSYSINPTDAAATLYTWSVNGGGNLGSTTGTTVNVTWTGAGTHILKAIASNACGNGPERSLSINVSAGGPTATPVISANGNVLAVASTPTGVMGYRWFRDTAVVQGANGSSLQVSQDGNYSVRFLNPCGEGPKSNVIQFKGNRQNQTVTFTQIADKTFGQVSYVVLNATASSGLPVTYSLLSSSGSGSIKEDTLFISGAGVFNLRATQPGNTTTYNPASADISFEVKKATATINFSNLTQVYDGGAKQPTITTVPTGLVVNLAYNGNAQTPSNAGTYKVVGLVSSQNYEGKDSASFVIQKASQTITLTPVPDLALTTPAYKISAVASSGLPVSFSLNAAPAGSATLSGDTIFTKSVGTGILVASQGGNSNYNAAASVKDTFAIRKASQTITFQPIANKVVSDAPFGITAAASSGLPVSLKIVSGPATLSGDIITLTGIGTVKVEAEQPGNALYAPADPVQQSFEVSGTNSVSKYPDLAVQDVASNKNVLDAGESVTVSWKIANIGNAPAAAKWTENIYVQSPNGQNRTSVQTVNFSGNNALDSGKTVSRNAVVALPLNLNIGDQGVFVIEVVPDTSISEAEGGEANNIGVQQTAWNIRKILTLDLSADQITEGDTVGITATISRTGSLAAALTVQVSAKYSQKFGLPLSVVIPAGQAAVSFAIAPPNNNAVEGTLVDSVKVSAANFTTASAPLQLLDNDQASLTITNLPSQAAEGETVTFKVTTDLAPTAPLTVYLTSSAQTRFAVPATLTIPAGSLSATATVVIPQNTTPEIDQTIEIKAGAQAHNFAAKTVQVKDDDLPNLELVLQTKTVSEGAGFYATEATLRRTSTNNPVAFTANLSANLSNTLILPGSISLAAGQNEKTFTVGVIDNALADGQRQVAITASIFVASCGCSAPPQTSGSVSATLTVNDDDGPALILTASPLTLPEGATAAGALHIVRNTPSTSALTVKLLTSDSSEATLPATAIIPAGSDFVDVPIKTYNDGITDGNQQVYFNATATGFSTGTVWVIVTDQNKPDLQIPTVQLPDSNVQAKNLFTYNFSVKNSGFSTAPTGVVVHGYLSKDDVLDESDTLIAEDVLSTPIPAGQTVPVINSVIAPNIPGAYKLLFKVNPDASLTELTGINNTSRAVSFYIKPDYTANAVVSQTYFAKGGPVPVTGTATLTNGTPARKVAVEVYVITDGLRRTVQTATDTFGKFSTQFVPISSEAGHYTVGASYPGLKLTDTQDEFDILGVRINGGEIPRFRVTLNDTLAGTLKVENLSSTTLTNFTLNPTKLPGGASITFATAASFAGNSTINLAYKVVGKALSSGTNYEVASFVVAGKGMNIQTADVFYYCQAPKAYVVADITSIKVSVSKISGERLVEFKLKNKGIGSTGAISLVLPQADWITSVTPAIMPSLNQGDSTTVILKYLATEDVPFDYPINGNIGIRTENGNSFVIPFVFQKVAVSKGAVKVTVTDQFTYYTEAGPNVAGAFVSIKNYFSGETYAEGYTDANGVFAAANVPEGKHRITVDKEKHLPYSGTVTIEPGDTTSTTVFINYQAITFSWQVVPTAIQDKYDITLVTKFETDVPVPVVTIEMPKSVPALTGSNEFAFNVTLTNHGLITAKDVALNLPTTDPEYEFVTNYTPADLLAQQSIQVPVIMRRRTSAVTGRSGSPSIAQISQFLGMKSSQYSAVADEGLDCVDFVGVVYWYKCSLATGLWQRGGVLFSFEGRICGGPITGIFDPGPEGGPGGGTGYPVCAECPEPICFDCGVDYTPPEYKDERSSCLHCITDIISAAAGCAGATGPSFAICAFGVWYDNGGVLDYITSCAPGLAPGEIGCIAGILGAINTCGHTEVGGRQVQGIGNNKKSANTVEQLPAVFAEIAANLQIVDDAYKARENWGKEYFGGLMYNNAWKDLEPKIDSYITGLDSIPLQKQSEILAAMQGYDISASDIKAFFTRWNTSLHARSIGVLTPNAQYPSIINWIRVKAYSDSMVNATKQAVAKGFASVYDMYEQEYKALNEILDQQSHQAVCASVTVQFSQTLTMTREAFRGTLEIFNGHPTDKMDSLSVNLLITDQNGVPSNGLFQINTESLVGLSDVTGTGAINSQQKGRVTFLFIPTLKAAPTEPIVYNFGGSVRYFDPYAQAMVTFPLNPVPLTVNPSPNLMLHYFLQRNILSDDPLTPDKIEPTVPAELSVMVENQGYGPAVNTIISSAQPKIIENEKGLAIEFKLIGSKFQGKPANFGVTDINFGTIPPLQTRVGEWYLTSTLLGKFVSYEAKVVHANSFGNPELSLVKGVKLHELTKSIRLYGSLDDGINDFLVNDVFDVADRPDIIYFSQGNRTEKVYPAADGSFSSAVGGPTFTNQLTVTASDTGWNYIKLSDPGNGQYELVSVTRSDGQAIPLDNAWLSFVTLPVSRPPVYENKFHFVDFFPSEKPVTYTVVWTPKDLNVPTVVSINGAPTQVSASQVKNLTVVFDKPIDAATFGPEDLSLTLQGGSNIIDATAVITKLDSVTFSVDLSKLTVGNGFYAFAVQAAGVKDIFGISGTSGKQVTWTQFLTIPTVQAFLGLPEGNTAASFDTIRVLFNLPIDQSSATPSRFIITKDGKVQSGSVIIDSVRADKKLFYLSGLKNVLTESGEYLFTVDLPKIKTTGNVFGTEQQSVKLTVDNKGPVLVKFEKLDSLGLDPQHIPFVRLNFNENVYDFNTASLALTRNGEELPLTFNMLSNTDLKSWTAGPFGIFTYPDGVYKFTVNLSGLKDKAGNSGIGTQSLTWTVNRSALITVSNLKVTPDLGYSDKDDITSGGSFTASFDLKGNASQVTVSQVDKSGETVLTTTGSKAAGAVSIPVTLVKGGNTGLKITATGSNGGVDTIQKSLYVDESPLTGQWLRMPNQNFKTQTDTVAVLFSAKLLNSNDALNALQLSRNEAPLSTTKLSLNKLNDTIYRVTGLQGISNLPGTYRLTLDLNSLKKYTSGLLGNNAISVAWTVLSANQPPVAKAGKDTLITRPVAVMLDGSASFDPDGTPLIYRWVAPKGVVLNDSTVAKPSFNVSADMQGKALPFLLIVSDGETFATDGVNVTVRLCGTEVCNGVDDDCDGETDEGFTHTYYRDADGDGYGNPADSVIASECSIPINYIITAGDCDDGEKAVWRKGVFYKDSDGDGYTVGDAVAVCYGTSTPVGYKTTKSTTDDCDDTDASLHDGKTYYADSDGDGFGDPAKPKAYCSATAPAGYVADHSDCDDSKVLYEDKDADGYGSQKKVACGGVENNTDCDDNDKSLHAGFTYYRDNDKDGYGDPATVSFVCTAEPPQGYVRDNTDCNDNDKSAHAGFVFYKDADGDGFGDPSDSTLACTSLPPQGYVANNQDCDDSKVTYADNDGDGFGAGPKQPCGVAKSGDCNDGDKAIYPGAPEVIDGKDNNCNGQTDEVVVSVSNFVLVNASTDGDIFNLSDGDELDLSLLPQVRFNVRANTNPGKVGSVVFELSGTQRHKHTENGPPYALFGSTGNDYSGSSLMPGTYTLTATPYSKAKGQGVKGTQLTIHFTVVNLTTVVRFALVNANGGGALRELKEGDVLNLDSIAGKKLTIRAYTDPDTVGSVVFDMQGQQQILHSENLVPYVLLGGGEKHFVPWVPEPGNYTLTATPYSARRQRGAQGTGYTIHFVVVNGGTFTVSAPKPEPNPSGTGREKASLAAAPNPFTSRSTVRFTVPVSSHATLGLYNANGALVKQLFGGKMEGGKQYQTLLESKGLPAGVYTLRLVAGPETAYLKIVVIH